MFLKNVQNSKLEKLSDLKKVIATNKTYLYYSLFYIFATIIFPRYFQEY